MHTLIKLCELPKSVESEFEKHFKLVEMNIVELPTTKSSENAVGLITAPGLQLDQQHIACLSRSIKAVGTYSVGTDHIDLKACEALGIKVVNTPDVLSDATSDTAILLMLMAMRGASRSERLLRSGAWDGWRPTQIFGRDVSGKKLGILGYGRIGKMTAKKARVFGLDVIHWDRNDKGKIDDYSKPIRDFDSFLGKSDILSLHAPSTPQTQKIINEETIAKLPDDAVVVNTARGDLIDDDALIDALRSDRIYAAGLDVFNNEPAVDPRYVGLKNVSLLPHIGSSTKETRFRMGMLLLDGLINAVVEKP